MRRSHATASCIPAPIAGPFTAAITGEGWATIASSSSSNAGRNVSTGPCVLSSVCAKRVTRSAPAQNALPAPVITIARSSAVAASRSRSSMQRSPFSALRRSGRLIVATPTSPRVSNSIIDVSVFVDESDDVALLHRLLGLHVKLPHDTGHFSDHGYLHLHRLENADLVAFRDHLPFFDDDLPDVRGDLGLDLVHLANLTGYTGSTPCLRSGRTTRLSALIRKPRAIAARVSAGSITSSSWAWPAAIYGSMLARISSASSSRLAARSVSSSITSSVLRWMMLTAPSGPITAISAVGHATM